MADIELVIKTSDEFYKRCKRECDEDETNGFIIDMVTLAIGNGTPLPKGHGRLKDVDALYDRAKLCHTEEDGTACVEWREINDAPTIIEADKES